MHKQGDNKMNFKTQPYKETEKLKLRHDLNKQLSRITQLTLAANYLTQN